MKNRKNNKKSKILSPKALSTILANVNQTNEVIDQGFFRGIFNQNTQHEDACYCYAISFIQLILHDDMVINYLQNDRLVNPNDKLLRRVYNRLHKKNIKAIRINDFFQECKCWLGGLSIPNIRNDSIDFCQYLFNSLSPNFQDMFLFDIDFNDEFFFEKNDPFFNKYYLKLPITNTSVQKIIDDKFSNANSIKKIPRNLLISLIRHDNGNFNDQTILINSYVQILSFSTNRVYNLVETKQSN